MTHKMIAAIGMMLLVLGVGCVPSAAPPEDIDPFRETIATVLVVDQNDNPVPEVELLYREAVNRFVVTHVVGAPTPEATEPSRMLNWQVANCHDTGPEDVCSAFTVRLACDKAYVIEARHPAYQFEMGFVTTSLVNDRCQADQPELTLYEYESVKVCTAIAVAAINLTVVDENNNKLTPARVAFRINEGEWEVPQAVDFCRDGEICGGSFAGGWELAGHYEIRVEADGYIPVTTTADVEMEADGCHVDGQVITIPLQPGESPDDEMMPMCPDSVVPSMYIDVMDENQLPLPWATVTHQIDGGEWLSATCVDSDRCTIFQAGADQPGSFIIRAEKAGYQTGLTVSTVPLHPNGCHVVTQRVQIILVPEE